MKYPLLISLLIIFSCAQKEKPPKKLLEVVVSPSAVNSCKEYQRNVLDRAYTQNKDGSVVFTRDTKIATRSLSKFDYEIGLARTRADMVQNLLQDCNTVTKNKFNLDYKKLSACSITFSELNFFQGLATALNKYPWPIDLQLEGKKVALDYVRFFSEGNYPLLSRLVALSVLDELSVNHVVNKELHEEIKALMQESQVYVQGLQMKLSKNSDVSCETIESELTYSRQVGNKMKDLLLRI